jgi:hypothetical protein
MRSCSAESRMFSTRRLRYRGGFDQVALPALDRQQVGRGAGDDQFADEVDELVELVGMHALKFQSKLFRELTTEWFLKVKVVQFK